MAVEKQKENSIRQRQLLEEIEHLQTLSKTQAAQLSQADLQLQHTHHALRKEADGRQQLAMALRQANQRLAAQAVDRAAELTQHHQIELARKHQHQQSQLVSNVTRRIREPLEIKEILRRAVIEVQAILKCDRVIVIERQGDSGGQVIEESTLPDIQPSLLNRAVTDLTLPDRPDTTGPQVCVVEDLTQHPCTLCSRYFLKQFQMRASLEISIYAQNQPWGLLVACQNGIAREWQPFEIELMEQLADQMSVAIAQAQLLDNLEALVEQRTLQLRLITDALPVLICYIDADQRYRFSNKTYTDWFGQSVEAMEGRRVQEIIGDSYYQQAQPYIEKALSGQAVHYESTATFLNNKIRDLAATYIPDIAADGQVKGFFGLTDDISDRKANERIQNEFISMVSHELRTPLTSIHGSLKLMSMMQSARC